MISGWSGRDDHCCSWEEFIEMCDASWSKAKIAEVMCPGACG